MHRRYLQTRNMDANDMDASPLLGVCGIDALASESDVSTVARTTQNRTEKPAGAAPEYVSVRVRLMTTDMPAPPLANNPVLGNNAQRCSSTTVVSSLKRPDTRRSHASAMSMQTFSPLVRTPSRRRASMSASADTREISLTIRSSHTIEELATRIEGLANDGEESGDCMALFKGGRPLQFASRVADVLEAGDVVTAFKTGDIPEIDDDDYSYPPAPDKDRHHSQHQRRTSDAISVMTLSNIDMTRVGDLVAQAPLKARFINTLTHPVPLRAFLEFCALPSELALESLLFVLDVERFRHVQPSMARLLANYIYLSYVAPSAPLRINVSNQMRERIPWPFLPGWEYNPWVFDEILASVGFTLKKHTLLRFERSPVGLVSLMGSPDFDSDDYIMPLQCDLDYDPMVAIAEHFEPDIDVVIWVNDLEFDTAGSHLVTNLSRLTVSFREQLLERIAAQFVDERRAVTLCSGYFRLLSQLQPLQKQRKIRKTKKIRNFFGDNPHEALLRQQLMAVVPPSSHMPAARAAAELVARKKNRELKIRASRLHRRQSSDMSDLTGAQDLLGIDSDSELEKEYMQGWAAQAMQRPPTAEHTPMHGTSWSDTDDDSHGSADQSRQSARRGMYRVNDQTWNRALSMIGVSQPESLESSSSETESIGYSGRGSSTVAESRSACMMGVTTAISHLSTDGMFSPRIMFERKRRADKIREFFGRAGSDSYAESGSKSIAHSLATASPSLGSTTGKPSVDQGLSSEQRNLLVRRRRKLKAMLGDHVEDSVITTASMITPAAATIDSSGDESAPPVSERSLRVASPATALPTPEASAPSSIGSENVDFELRDAQIRQLTKIPEVLGEAAPQPLLYSIKTKRGHSICMHESLVQSSDVVNAEAPVSHRMRSRIRWQRNKLMRVLGDVPSSFTSSYATNALDNDDLSGVSESEVEDAVKKSVRQQRTRAKKLRQFFGQSLAPDAVMLQNFTRANRHLESLAEDVEGDAAADESYASGALRSPDTSVSPPSMLVDSPQQQQHHISALTGSSSGQWPNKGADKTSCVTSDLGGPGSTSFDGVKPDTGGFADEPAHQVPPPLPPQFPQILPDLVGTPESGESFPRPIRAQFWMTSSPESQASTVASQEKAKRRTSLMSHLRARKASIIGSIMRATPSTSSLHHGLGRDTPTSTLRLRASTHSSTDSFDLPRNKRHSSLSLPPSAISATSRLNFLSRRLGRMPVSPGACSARSPASTSNSFTPMLNDARLWVQPPLLSVARGSPKKRLSPLPTISPNNFQASFDRGMALREIVAVADYISSHGAASFGHSSAEESGKAQKSARAARMEAHRQVVASALLVADNPLHDIRVVEAASKMHKQAIPPATSKSVHWFDSPKAERKRAPNRNSRRKRRAQRCDPPMSPLREERQQIVSPQMASAKISSEMSMSIVLRSPSTKSSAITSPLSSPKTITGPLPSAAGPVYPHISFMSPMSPPRMALSHKASISAVGGRRNCSPHLHQQPPPSVTTSNIVTIRARRSQSFAVQRRLARATSGGRRRSNTVGTGKQVDSDDSRDNDSDPTAFPVADKAKRRVKSMIIEPQSPFDVRPIRNRYMTVIPLRVELQRHLLMKLAKDGIVSTNTQQLLPLSGSDGLFLEDTGVDPRGSLHANTHRMSDHIRSRASSTASFRTAQSVLSPTSALIEEPSFLLGSTKMRLRKTRSWTHRPLCRPSYGATHRRSRSCQDPFSTTSLGRTLRRYTPRFNSTTYQRLSLARLSRPAASAVKLDMDSRRSLDTRITRNYSLPYTAMSLRRFASFSNHTKV